MEGSIKQMRKNVNGSFEQKNVNGSFEGGKS